MIDSRDGQRSERLELGRRIAREAGQLTLGYFRQAIDVQRKSDDSPVTVADREAEQILRRRICEAYPDDAIVGEEFDDKLGTSGYRWILDPIDGTKSFISGVPLYGTLIGVELDDRIELGIIYIPYLDEGVYAARDGGAWHHVREAEPVAAHVSDCDSLAQGLFVTSQVDSFTRRGAQDAFERLQEIAWITRTWGDCYGYLLVATGRATVMVDPEMSVWDAAAIQPILEEAGGTFTDWQGTPTIRGQEGIGTNGNVFSEVLAITREFPRSRDGES